MTLSLNLVGAALFLNPKLSFDLMYWGLKSEALLETFSLPVERDNLILDHCSLVFGKLCFIN